MATFDQYEDNGLHNKESVRESGRDRDILREKEKEYHKERDSSRRRKHRDKEHEDEDRKDRDSRSRSERHGRDHGSEGHQSRDRDLRRSRDRSPGRSRGRSRDRSRERARRHHDYDDSVRDSRHSRRTHSRSRGISKDRARSRSRSGSRDEKSKRASGFDMAPSSVPFLPGMTLPGQLPGMPQTLPTVFPGFPFAGTQIGNIAALSAMPMQAMTQQQAMKHARRVYVGGLPPLANEQTIATYFSQVMQIIGGNSAPGDAVVNVYINHEKKFAFVEMRTVEEASNAMALDGIMFEGMPVRVRRPSDYNPSLAATLGPSQPNPHLNLAAVGLTPGIAGGADGPDKVFVGGLPYYLTEAQIKELLESFGPLRGFDLVKDRETGNSKGYAFCVYQDPVVTDVACAALNGLKMGDKTLTVRRATAGGQPKSDQENVLFQAQQQIAMQKLALQAGVAYSLITGMPTGAGASSGVSHTETPTKVLCLTQLVSVDELRDDSEFGDIYQDIHDECTKYGSIVNLVIPRPSSTGENVPGLGKAFVEYTDVQGSSKARAALNGRKFAGNTVLAVYYPEDKFSRRELDG